MSVLDTKLRREIGSSKGMLLAIVSIMAVGVGEYVALSTSYNNLHEAKGRYYRQCRVADFWIEVKKVPLAELEAVREVPGVAELRPRIQFFATVDAEDADEPLNALVLTLPEEREPAMCDVVLKRGGYFSDRRENEVIVNEAFAAAHRLHPGDWIKLVLNNRQQELFIVGTAVSAEFVYPLGPGAIVPDPEHFGIFYLKHRYAEDVFDFDGAANQVLGRLAPGARDREQEVLRRAEDLLDPYGVITTIPLADQPSNKYLSQEIQGLRSFGFFLPAIFLSVAALVLNVLLSRLAEQQRTVVGTLKALGYSDLQVFGHFLKFGLCVGVVGGLLGCGLGWGIAWLMTVQYRTVFEFPELNNHFYAGLHATGLAISTACSVVGSLHGARQALRLNPAAAMRPKPPKQGGAILLERATWLWSRLSSGWRMVLRSVVRNRFRTAAGTFAAAMGASVLVCGFMMAEATNYLIDFQFKWIWKSDFDLTFKDERGEDALLEAAQLPGVDRAEPFLTVPCTFVNGPHRRKGGITGLEPGATLTVPRDLAGRAIRIPPHGLAMSRKLAEVLCLGRGDRVRIEPTQGLREPREAVVMEIADSYLGTSVYADIHYLSGLVGEELAVSGVQLAVDGKPEHLKALYRELKELPALQAVSSRGDMVESLEKTLIDVMWIFIGMLALFAGIIFFGSILNSSLVSLAERQREVATLRVLGYSPWQVGTLLLRESLIVSLVGSVLGMPLGYLLTVLVARLYESEMFRFPVVSSAGTWIWTAVLAVVFTLTAHLLVERAVHRIDWLEALKAQE